MKSSKSSKQRAVKIFVHLDRGVVRNQQGLLADLLEVPGNQIQGRVILEAPDR